MPPMSVRVYATPGSVGWKTMPGMKPPPPPMRTFVHVVAASAIAATTGSVRSDLIFIFMKLRSHEVASLSTSKQWQMRRAHIARTICTHLPTPFKNIVTGANDYCPGNPDQSGSQHPSKFRMSSRGPFSASIEPQISERHPPGFKLGMNPNRADTRHAIEQIVPQ